MSFSDQSNANWVLAVRALPALKAELGPEERARSIALADLAKRKFLICFHCKCENEIPSSELRMFLCKKCRKEIWVTARTNYHKARKFLVRILIMRLKEMGIYLTANQAAELLGVTNDTVNRIYKQLGIIVISRLPKKAAEVPSQHALPVVCRRTTETPAGKPPFEEEFEMQKKHQEQIEQLVSANATCPGMPELSELEFQILEILSETSIHFDELAERSQSASSALSSALTYLELRGLIQAQPGNRFAKAKSLFIKNADGSERKKSLAQGLNYFIKDHSQGIGRKNIQIYSCLFWVASDRKTWRINSLRELYAAHPYVSYKDILEFVTPLTFMIVPCFNTS